MKLKQKMSITLLTIITLGFYLFFKSKNNRRKADIQEEEIKVDFPINKLIKELGGHENILGIEYSKIKIKIFIEDREEVDVNAIKDMKEVSGIFVNSKFITIKVGKKAKIIAEKLI